MKAGTLRHKATFYTVSDSPGQDAYGDAVLTRTPFASGVPVSLTPMQGREWFFAKQSQSENMVTLRLRYMAGITSRMLVEVNGVTYEIESVVNVSERNRELELRVSVKNG